VREVGAILLVSCYELGHQPLGVAWPRAFLERAGFRPTALDVAVEPLDEARVRQARLVAIAVPMHTALRLGVEVAARVRALNPAAHLCFHGLYALLNREHLLARGADSVLGGESEGALVALAEALEAAGPGPRPAAPGPAGPARPVLERLAFPVPSRRGLPPLARYARLEHEGRRDLAAAVEASRGCRHRCRHCPIPPVYGGRFFVVPLAVVLADVRQVVEAGARHVTFADPDFLNGPGHAFAVARALHAEFAGVTFDVTAKVEHLRRHRARLAELRALGCAFVVTAAESLSDTVLGHLAKGHTRADVRAVVREAREAGLPLRPTWVPFTPWTAAADYRELLDFVDGEGLVDHVDPVQYSLRLLVPPGSLLADLPAFRPFRGPLAPEAFEYRWAHPDPAMDTLQAAVAARVAAGAEAGEDGAVTFAAVRDLAAGPAEAGAPRAGAAAGTIRPGPARPRPPRLTEAWFC
jgi:radical SAM superfamily enzyme YgiQ (UPF0313 family)